jgi:hypothetical protein
MPKGTPTPKGGPIKSLPPTSSKPVPVDRPGIYQPKGK